jgi:hypothetical protein
MVVSRNMRRLFVSWREVPENLAKTTRTIRRRKNQMGLPIHSPLNQRIGAFFAGSENIHKFAAREPNTFIQTHINLPRQRQSTANKWAPDSVNQPTERFRIS